MFCFFLNYNTVGWSNFNNILYKKHTQKKKGKKKETI